MSKTKISF